MYRLEDLRLTSGARAGLDDATATAELFIDDPAADPAGPAPGLAATLARLVTAEPFAGIDPDALPRSWPAALVQPAAPALPQREPTRAEWFVAITVALQRLAREPVRRGAVLAVSSPGRCRIALPWVRASVLREAVAFAARWLAAADLPDARLRDRTLEALHRVVDLWLEGARRRGVSPITQRFALAARARGVPARVEPEGNLVLGWGAAARRLRSTFTDGTSVLAVGLARRKDQTIAVLRRARIPVPEGRLVTSLEEARAAAAELGWPLVVKPAGLDQGLGVVPGIRETRRFEEAAAAAFALDRSVLVERHVEGDDHRMLVVGGRLLAAARRIPATVVGDGVASVRALVDRVNADPRRGTDKRGMLMALSLDDEAHACLAAQGLDADAVPRRGVEVRLRLNANVSTGGTAVDVTAGVHPDNRSLAERAARIVGLDIAGVDLLCPDIGRSWRELGGAICEVNAQPALRPHWLAQPARDLEGEILDAMFDADRGRVPSVCVVGDDSADAVAAALHAMWVEAGITAGLCTPTRLAVGAEPIAIAQSGERLPVLDDCRALTVDPAVRALVIASPLSLLHRTGHPLDRYDVVAILEPAEGSWASAFAGAAEALDDLVRRATRGVLREGLRPGEEPRKRVARLAAAISRASGLSPRAAAG